MTCRVRGKLVAAWALAALALALPSRVGAATPQLELAAGACDLASEDVVLVGTIDPVPVPLEGSGTSFGLRGGVSLGRWRVMGELSRAWRDPGVGDLERQRFDLQVGRLIGRPGTARLMLLGGAGVSRIRATDAQEAESRSGSVGTLMLGVGGHVPIGARFYLTPELTARHHAGGADGVDLELSVGFGFVLGKSGRAASAMPPPSN